MMIITPAPTAINPADTPAITGTTNDMSSSEINIMSEVYMRSCTRQWIQISVS